MGVLALLLLVGFAVVVCLGLQAPVFKPVRVALTRELGSNDALAHLLSGDDFIEV